MSPQVKQRLIFVLFLALLKKGCYTNEQFIYNPTALIVDTACSITNGFIASFG